MQVSTEDITLVAGGITLVIAILAGFFFLMVVRYFKINRMKQKEIFNAVLLAQENERTRIAEDLHDQIGPMLSAVRLNIGLINSQREGELIFSTVKEAQGNLDTAIHDVRRISHNLVPGNIEQKGLSLSVSDYLNYLQKSNTVQLNFEKNANNITFNKLVDTNLYRIVQELVNNAIRHGNATIINVQMLMGEREFLLAISDNGTGFKSSDKQDGIGMKSIRSRVELYGGQCEWNSEPGQGTKFKAIFDIKQFS